MKTRTSPFHLARFIIAPRRLLVAALSLLAWLAPLTSAAAGNVVISQVFGGGGGTGYYKYDYIELYNRTDAAANLTGWSLQYASVAGAFSSVYALPSGTVIPPGGYLLVQCSSAGTGGIGFPVAPDLVTIVLNLSQASGKVALANVATALGTVSVLPDSRIVDFVGFGAANLGEGGATVNGGIALNNQQGSVRKAGGAVDNDNNNLDFDVVSQPVPRNSTVGRVSFFADNLLPPTNGLCAAPLAGRLLFANGVIISNLVQRVFAGGVLPPSPGVAANDTFGSTLEFDVSIDSGTSWASVVVPNNPATVMLGVNVTVGGYAVYSNVMTSWTVVGGGLPTGVMIRESPTLSSSGQTRVKAISGGYMISSFFDIFTEVSTDSGNSWQPATNGAVHLETKPDPQLIPPALAPRTLLPMPNGQDFCSAPWFQLYANGIVIKDVRHKLFTGWMEPPIFGGSQTQTFDSQLDFQLSIDGGMHFTPARAPATVTFTISDVREFQGRKTYDTEITQLDIAGGDLPVGVMIRESPTKASKGGTSSQGGGGGGGAGGGAAISSFFDIFTEVTTDSGATWSAGTNGPAHVETRRIAPVGAYPNNLFPQLAGQYYCPQPWFAYYANGIVITNFINHTFTSAITPPAPGLATSHTFGSTVEFDVSYDGGVTYTHTTAPATDSVQITGRLGDDGVTTYYDTEMTQLSISGGGLPANIQIRESPTKASLGRTTSSAVSGGAGSYQTDSFFDIFTEVSTDGGISWMPSVAGPGTVVLRLPVVPVTPATITGIVPTNGGCLINYANGSGSQFILLATPILSVPMSAWTPVATNSTGTGSFWVKPTTTTFYRVQSQ